MKKRTHLFLIAIDEDPIPGLFHGDRIIEDVTGVIERCFISAYNAQINHLGATTRESNFTKDTELLVNVDYVVNPTNETPVNPDTQLITFCYKAKRPK